MIDEPRETKREKRDAARQARVEQQRRRQRARRRKKALIGGLSAVLVIALVAFAAVQISQSKSRSQAAIRAAATAAGCDGLIQYPDAGHQHIDNTPDKRRPYTSTPPTSGDHYGVLPPPPSFYTEQALRPETYVHALEHGQIVIHYNDIPKVQVDELQKIQSEHSASTTVMKDADIKAPVAITAWRYMEQCQKVSKPVIENFIEQRCNKGPENFNLEC